MTSREASDITVGAEESAVPPLAPDWFTRLIPECVPRTFAEPTPELTERVARGLLRLTDDGQ